MAQQRLVGQGLLIIEASWSYSDTPHSVYSIPLDQRSAWRRDLYLTTHNTQKRRLHPCLRRDLNPQSQPICSSTQQRQQIRHTNHWLLGKVLDEDGNSLESERMIKVVLCGLRYVQHIRKLEHGLVTLPSVHLGALVWKPRKKYSYKIKLRILDSRSYRKMAALFSKSGSCFLMTTMGAWVTGTRKVNDSGN
jgi:hypothetical protein